MLRIMWLQMYSLEISFAFINIKAGNGGSGPADSIGRDREKKDLPETAPT